MAQPRRTPPPRTLTRPFEYSVAVCAEDDVSVRVRPDGVVAGEGASSALPPCDGVDGTAVEPSDVIDEIDEWCEWLDSDRCD